jgi:polysaccharide export outer membrane protein
MKVTSSGLRVTILCFAGLALVSAASKLSAESKKDKNAATAAPAAAGASSTAVDPKSFTIGPEDVLAVKVWRNNEVSGNVVVRPDGRITLQLLGEIQAAGLTPEALQQVIYDGISKLENRDKSEITVTVVQVNSRKYFITGEVGRSGPYALLHQTTILEAIIAAGGFREFANQKKIVLLRAGKQYYFNYKEVIHGKKLEQNKELEPGDQIIVP